MGVISEPLCEIKKKRVKRKIKYRTKIVFPKLAKTSGFEPFLFNEEPLLVFWTFLRGLKGVLCWTFGNT